MKTRSGAAIVFLLLFARSFLYSQNEPLLLMPSVADPAAVRTHFGYILEYSEEHEQPRWVAYELTAREARSEEARRLNRFRTDPQIPTGSADPDDYLGSGFDRGHLAPAADFAWAPEAMDATFYLSNISPMEHSFNAGDWRRIESFIHRLAEEDGRRLWIVTGPILVFGDASPARIGPNGVAVPERFYKIAVDVSSPILESWAFLVEHENRRLELESYLVSIDEIEAASGIDFFWMLDDALEIPLESRGGRPADE
jgi:endonuclease G